MERYAQATKLFIKKSLANYSFHENKFWSHLTHEYFFQVGFALKVNGDHRQYISLGFLVSACITIPETCGPEDAAISFWFKLPSSCDNYSGIITSAPNVASGFVLECNSNGLR